MIHCPDLSVKVGSSKGPGRPAKLFKDKGPDAKYKEASEILEKYSLDAIIRAATLGSRRKNYVHAASIFQHLEEETDFNALRLRKAKKFFENHPRKKLIQCVHCTYLARSTNLYFDL